MNVDTNIVTVSKEKIKPFIFILIYQVLLIVSKNYLRFSHQTRFQKGTCCPESSGFDIRTGILCSIRINQIPHNPVVPGIHHLN
jgi:hypothetical protein